MDMETIMTTNIDSLTIMEPMKKKLLVPLHSFLDRLEKIKAKAHHLLHNVDSEEKAIEEGLFDF